MANNKRKNRKKIIIIIGIVVILAGIVIANLLRKTEKPLEVNFDEVKRGSITQIVSASGKIRPVVEVKISAKVSGNITALPVKEGDWVHKGQLLLKLDRERYAAMVERAQSALKSTQASLWKSDAEFNRLKELYRNNLASQAELQAAEASFKLAESEVEQAQAGLKEAQDDLSKTEIYAPMDGIVSQMNKELGEMVLGASFQEDVIMVVSDLSQMKAEVEVDENDVVDVNLGDTAKIEIDAFPDTTFKGKVSRIANTATTRAAGTTEEVTNFLVEISVLDRIKGVRPGMSSSVDISVEKHDSALYIPIQCVAMRSPEKKAVLDKKKKAKKGKENPAPADSLNKSEAEKLIEVVFRVEGDTARMIPVKTGISSETDIEILEGLTQGQKVVSGPYRVLANKIQDGNLIKEKKKTKPEAEKATGKEEEQDNERHGN